MAYNPTTGHLLIVSRTNLSTGDAYTIAIIDGATGADVGTLALGITGIGADTGFDYNAIAVADDGAIYVCDLSSKTTTTGVFNLYRWANESSPQVQIFGSDPSFGDPNSGNNRWGDSMVAAGSGTGTKILITSRGTLAAILTPSDPSGTAPWAEALLQTDVPNGDIGYGLAFGAGNTFWAKSASGDGNPLYLLSYNTGTGTATTLHSYSTLVFPGWTGILGAQPSSNLLAGLEIPPGRAANVRLYDVSNPANPPVLLDRKVWVTNDSGNGVFAGSLAFAGTNLYGLNSDNGIMAFSVISGATPSLAPMITRNPANAAAANQANASFTAAADGVPAPKYFWYFNTNTSIANATNATLTVSNIVPANFGFYSLVASNISGMATSALATLSEAIAFKNGVFYEPFNYNVGSQLYGLGGWVTNTATTSQSFIEAGNLGVPGLAFPLGNHYAWQSNITVRLPFGTQTNGTIYFSFAVQISQITTNLGEDTFAGLAYFSGTSLFPKVDAYTSGPNSYQIGMFKGSGTNGNGGVYTGQTFTTNDIVFVVGRLVINTATTSDDTCDLWVNPDPSTFGADNPPAPSVGNINGKGDQVVTGNISGVDRFSWRGIVSGIKHSVDELRIGFTWASVTPLPTYSLSVAKSGGNIVVSWPTNGSDAYALLSTTDLAAGGWITNMPIVVQGTNNTFTVTGATGQQFFRLKK
jgi:hypothetical protein